MEPIRLIAAIPPLLVFGALLWYLRRVEARVAEAEREAE